MDRKKMLNKKIELECGQYCRKILRKRTGTFRETVEKVENYKKLSGLAIQCCGAVSEKEAEILLIFPNLLMYFYRKWIQQENSMDESITMAIDKIITAYTRIESEEKEDETSGINNRAS